MNLRRLGPALLVLVALAAWWLWPGRKPSPEQQVRNVVARVVGAAEHRDAAAIMSTISPRFHGGAFSRDELRGLVLGQFLGARGDDIHVVNPRLEVTITGPESATFDGTFVLNRGGELRQLEVNATLERTGDDWLVTSATWH